MKIFHLFLFLGCLFILTTTHAQKGWRDHEMEVRVTIKNPQDATKLGDLHLNGDIHVPSGYALMYVIPSELEKIKGTGLPIEILKNDLNDYYKDFWSPKSDQYHDYDQIISLMDSLATAFPSICKKTVFGLTPQGRQLTCLEISKNVGMDENEPEVMFDGGIHGDEIGGPENLIRFARYLCTSYGTDTEVTAMLNSRAITIYPMVNPDGRANMSRYNSNMVDCNRDWGYMWDAQGNSTAAFSQPETRAIRNLIYNHHFVIHVTYHSGEEVVLYPWCYRASHTPNYAAQLHLATIYSDSSGYPNLQFRQSYADYPTNGETIDYSYGADGTDALTVEISTNKQPPASQIQYYYLNNQPAMMAMIKNAGYGISGTITDSITGFPVRANIFINDFFPVTSDSTMGDYHVYLPAGTYSIKVTANNYGSKIIHDVVVNDFSATQEDFQLSPVHGHYAAKVAAVVIPGNNPADAANTPAVIGAPDSINYSTGRNGWIIVDMQEPVTNIPGYDFRVVEGDTTPEGYTCLAGNSMDGPWTLLGPGTGSTYYDLDSAGLSSVRFIRIIDDGDGLGNVAGAGFDLDGIECMISTVGVRVIGKGNSLLSVTPNPASERISVRLMSPEKEGILDIYNSRGETMMTAPVTGSRLQLDISGFPPGLYFVNFTNYRTSEVTRLIKE